jgi:hypothetical protein
MRYDGTIRRGPRPEELKVETKTASTDTRDPLAPEVPVRLDFHHVTSAEMLCAFHNAIVQAGHVGSLRQWLGNCGYAQARLTEMMRQFELRTRFPEQDRELPTFAGRRDRSRGRDAAGDYPREWLRVQMDIPIVWGRWNLVVGPEPNARSDDPQDGSQIDFRGGGAGRYAPRIRRVVAVAREIRDLAAQIRDGQISDGDLKARIKSWMVLMAEREPVPFDNEMWIARRGATGAWLWRVR